MSYRVTIEIPNDIVFSDLGVYEDAGGKVTFRRSILEKLLDYNNLTLSQLADEDIDELLVLWYEKHIKRGGATDFYFERILGSNIGSQDFETEIQWNIVQAPPHHEKIKALRKHTGMSMRGSASLIGISGRKMIRGYERGERAPNDQTWTLWLLLTGQHPEVEVIKR